MQLHAALVREQGVDFVVVSVQVSAMNPGKRDKVSAGFGQVWPGVPVVLSSTQAGRTNYYGRPDLVRFLKHVAPQRLPWRVWTVT